MAIKRIRIYNNTEKFNTEEDPGFEVEQRLSINDDGRVQLMTKTYGEGYPRYAKGRKEVCEVEPEVIQDIFARLHEALENQPKYGIVPGYGMYELSVQDTRNATREYYGSMTGVLHDMTDYIQRRIPIDGLALFG